MKLFFAAIFLSALIVFSQAQELPPGTAYGCVPDQKGNYGPVCRLLLAQAPVQAPSYFTRLFTESFSCPVSGRISSGYGVRLHPILKKRRMHNGIDVSVPEGTAVKVAASGVIVFSGWNNGFGKRVVIDHGTRDGKRFYSTYNHLRSFSASVGQRVKKGEAIARVGSTGLSTGPHLHFEIAVGSQRNYVNPLDFACR